jgi:predicted O-linked N-acetylglucosamine transferase (SPINDLY family)
MGRNQSRHQSGAPNGAAAPSNALLALLQEGIQYHQAGNLTQAAENYQRVLDSQPGQPDALHLLGVIHHQGGEHDRAVELIRKSVKRNPKNADAFSNLGAALNALGEFDDAAKSFQRAVTLNPKFLDAHANLAVLAARRGADAQAIKSYRAAHKLKPEEPRFPQRLAELYLKLEQFSDARDWFGRYLSFAPDDSGAHNNLGYACERLDRLDEAEEHYRRAAELDPAKPETANNLASVLRKLGRGVEAEALTEQILASAPEQWEDPAHLAGALFNKGRITEALDLYEKLLVSRADDAGLFHDYGAALHQAGRLEDAEMALGRALELDGSMDASRVELGRVFLQGKRIEEATALLAAVPSKSPSFLAACLDLCLLYAESDKLKDACEIARQAADHRDFRPSMFIKPYSVFRGACAFDDIENLSGSLDEVEDYNLSKWAGLFLELLSWADTPERIEDLSDMHRRWGARLEKSIAANPLAPIDASGRTGPIRIGFLSSDLRAHSVARFVMPLFENYDRDAIDIYCYSPAEDLGDDIQNRIRTLVKEFRIIGDQSHRDLAETIRGDDIDVLFELNGFTADSRLPVMAFRAAPVQAYWLGYPFTTGVKEIDYMLLDPYVATTRPEWMVEKPLHMPGCWVCYDPFESTAVAAEPPVVRNGVVTFGTLNNPYKFTRGCIKLWAEVMGRVPGSRCLFAHPEYRNDVIADNIMAEFERAGIDRSRLKFLNNRDSGLSHFTFYEEIDLTLDSFPLTGGTTTCDALWMGVPLVTRFGPGMHQRLSYSHLNNVGLPELCADTDRAFVDIAVELALDTKKLRHLRRNLRQMVQESPLGSAPGFARDFGDLMQQVAKKHGLR